EQTRPNHRTRIPDACTQEIVSFADISHPIPTHCTHRCPLTALYGKRRHSQTHCSNRCQWTLLRPTQKQQAISISCCTGDLHFVRVHEATRSGSLCQSLHRKQSEQRQQSGTTVFG